MMAFLRDISRSIIQYLNHSMKSVTSIVFSFFILFIHESRFSLSALFDDLSFSRGWIMLVPFGFMYNLFFFFPCIVFRYFEGIKSTSQQVLLWDEQDPKLPACLFSLLFTVLVRTPITSSFSQDIHSFASSVTHAEKFQKMFSNVRFYFFVII